MSSTTSTSVVSEYVFNRGDGEVMIRAERASQFPGESSTAVNDETGHVAWQAMPVLCYFILSERGQQLLRNARVMELGAGIGVPGGVVSSPPHSLCVPVFRGLLGWVRVSCWQWTIYYVS